MIRAQADAGETKRPIFAALGLSILVHVLLRILVPSAAPELLAAAERHEIMATSIDLDDHSSDQPIADVPDRGEEARGQNAPATRAEKPTIQPEPLAPATNPSAPSPAKSAKPKAPTSMGDAQTSASAAARPSSSTANLDAEGQGRKLPSLVARFTHDLSAFGSGVSGWQQAAVGNIGSVTFALTTDADGKIDRTHDPFGGASAEFPRLLVLSVKRTVAALVTRTGSAGAVVRFRVTAVVSNVPAEEGSANEPRFDSFYDTKTRRGSSTFILDGRRVEFRIEVLAGAPVTASP